MNRDGGDDAASPRHWPLALATLFVLALGWRLFLLARLSRTPLLDALDADAAMYWAWAGTLRVRGWMGSNPFFLAPLYPYTVALLRSLTGDSIANVLAVQAFVGALAAPLLADVARRLTTPTIGFITGIIAAGYGMSALYGILVLSECLLFTLGSALVWVLVAWPWERRATAGAIAGGVLIGLMALGRATSLVLVIPLVALVLRWLPLARVARVLAITVAIVLALAIPVVIRHLALVHEWIPYTYSLGYNVFVGNGPLANGTFVPMRGPSLVAPDEALIEGGVLGDGRDLIRLATDRQLSPSESSEYWLEETGITVAAHPVRAARLLAFKVALLANWREVPQIEDPTAYARILGPLGLPMVGSFACVGVLGFAGALISIRRGRRERALAVYVLVLLLATSAFFVTARYRVHLVPALLPLAAVTLAASWRAIRSRDLRRIGRLGLVLIPGCVVVALPLLPEDRAHDEWSTATTLGEAWLRHGDPKAALTQFDRAIQIEVSGALRNAETPVARENRAAVHQMRGMTLLELGDVAGARASLQMASQLSPGDPQLLGALAQVYALEGEADSARAIFGRLGIAPTEAAKSLIERAAAQDRAGDPVGVESSLRAALALDPHEEAAWVGLVRMLAGKGQPDSALAVLDRARAEGVDPVVYAAHRVLIAKIAGHDEEARRWRASISDDRAMTDPRVRGTLELARARDR